MSKGVIAGVIAVVALLAIGGVLYMNNKDNKEPATSSTNTDSTAPADDAIDMPTPMPTTPESSSPPPAASSGSTEVAIENFAFGPKEITVKKGTKVTWTNNDSADHTVTGDNGGPDSELLSNGESYSFAFNTVGTFEYHCAPHPQMTGKVTVTE